MRNATHSAPPMEPLPRGQRSPPTPRPPLQVRLGSLSTQRPRRDPRMGRTCPNRRGPAPRPQRAPRWPSRRAAGPLPRRGASRLSLLPVRWPVGPRVGDHPATAGEVANLTPMLRSASVVISPGAIGTGARTGASQMPGRRISKGARQAQRQLQAHSGEAATDPQGVAAVRESGCARVAGRRSAEKALHPALAW